MPHAIMSFKRIVNPWGVRPYIRDQILVVIQNGKQYLANICGARGAKHADNIVANNALACIICQTFRNVILTFR